MRADRRIFAALADLENRRGVRIAKNARRQIGHKIRNVANSQKRGKASLDLFRQTPENKARTAEAVSRNGYSAAKRKNELLCTKSGKSRAVRVSNANDLVYFIIGYEAIDLVFNNKAYRSPNAQKSSVYEKRFTAAVSAGREVKIVFPISNAARPFEKDVDAPPRTGDGIVGVQSRPFVIGI